MHEPQKVSDSLSLLASVRRLAQQQARAIPLFLCFLGRFSNKNFAANNLAQHDEKICAIGWVLTPPKRPNLRLRIPEMMAASPCNLFNKIGFPALAWCLKAFSLIKMLQMCCCSAGGCVETPESLKGSAFMGLKMKRAVLHLIVLWH